MSNTSPTSALDESSQKYSENKERLDKSTALHKYAKKKGTMHIQWKKSGSDYQSDSVNHTVPD